MTTKIDREDFSLSSIDRMVDLLFILYFLDLLLKKHKKCCTDLEDSITRLKIITSHTQGLDGVQMKNVLLNFEEL